MARQRKTIRIVDIAREAGVANSVVSSLFSGNYYGKSKGAVVGIGEETKKRIWKSCRKLGYRPTDPVLLMEIYPEETDVVFMLNKRAGGFENSFFSLILDGLGEKAEANEVNLTLGRFDGNVDYLIEPDKIPLPVKNNPTGKFVLAGIPNYSLILLLIRSGAKIVYVSRHIEVPGVISLVPDYAAAAKLAVSRLIELGHREIVVFAAEHFREQGYSTKELVRGCTEALAEIGQEFSYDQLCFSGAGPERSREVIVSTLKNRKKPPTAAFCFDDFTATTVLKHVKELGVQVPEQLSIVGCNDEKISASLEPSLTTVHFPMYEIGCKAFDRVTHSAIHGVPSEAELEVWPVQLINRNSAIPL